MNNCEECEYCVDECCNDEACAGCFEDPEHRNFKKKLLEENDE